MKRYQKFISLFNRSSKKSITNKIPILYIFINFSNQNSPSKKRSKSGISNVSRISSYKISFSPEKKHVETFAECTGIACTFTKSLASSRREAGTSRWRGWEVEAYEWTVPYDSVSEWRRTEFLAHVWATCVGGLRGRNKEENIAEWRNKREGRYVTYEGEKDRRTIPYTYETFVLFAHCGTRVYYRIQRRTSRCDLLRNATVFVKPFGRFPEICIFRIWFFFPVVSK